MLNQELYKLLDINESDLAANRLGRMSERQIRMLEESSRKVRKYGIAIGTALTLLALGISAVIYFQGRAEAEALNQPIDYMQVLPGVIVVLTVCGVFAAISFWVALMKINTTMDKIEGKVNFVKVEKSVTEKSATGSTYRRNVQYYELRVGDMNFNNVPEEYLNVIEQGDIYAFYYLKEAKHILSAEFISKGT